ncbi:inositol monophosphatase family protein [Temperatibacter marinus]|uniref:Inositol-1-monophosphatase n=1 Tax=Temperatibacter marinus TaxID=1456591 RepID=A0AA52EDH0_9PROT|nr:inositol monophosphatase family protein [Temperatibacter marinus]WND02685.1 inositol monophosphatase family protein [Temperatibacter marinus]
MARRSPLMNVMVSAAHKAARHLRRDFNEVEQLQVTKKGPADFVSKADKKAESILVEELSKARPDFGFLLEEGGEIKGKSDVSRFIIDPLDGTTNFLHALPHWSISIAVEERGELIAGIVYDPIKEELFWAERGIGAYCNDTRIRVSGREKLDQSILATGIPFMGRGNHDLFLAEMKEIMPNVAGIRRFGAASLDLAYVAAGRYDGFWEASLEAWDMAAGILIVREAGGYVSDFSGKSEMLDSGSVIAGNSRLHAPLERMVRRVHRNHAK